MQTFLPWDDFDDSAASLDRLRLSKQRVETMQILNALEASQPERFPTSRIELAGTQRGWQNHPATLMWKGFEFALCQYGDAICNEWMSRGYNDGVHRRFDEFLEKHSTPSAFVTMPPWFGRPEFHASHRSALSAKMPEHYREQWPDDPARIDYWWPTQNGY